jgi:hypothetical protein
MFDVKLRLFPILVLVALPLESRAADSATEFLRFVYGATDVRTEEICWPNSDLWMLEGPKNPQGLQELAQLKLKAPRNGIIWEAIENGLSILELREGKVDARFILDQVYFRHRRTVLQFIYHALRHDKADLEQVTTNPRKVRFGATKPASDADMGVYQDIVAALPVLRVSQPAEDKVSRSVTYLVPLGSGGFKVKLVKRDRTWRVDTDGGVDVPLEVFYEQSEERRVVYPSR